MKSFALLAGLVAAASAQAMPKADIAAMSFPAPKSAPIGKGAGRDVVSYNPAAVYSSTYNAVFNGAKSSTRRGIGRGLERRHEEGDCLPQPLGAGPVPTNDTPDAFLADPYYSNAANSAQTPAGYVRTFQNLKGSTQGPMAYMGYDSVSAYDPTICSAQCNAKTGCVAFNLYFERDPSVDPGVNCPNPPSTTVIKCAYWGAPIEADGATNTGQQCADFHMVIAGSNGYVQQKPSVSVPGYTGTFLGDAAINAPTECNSYIGYQLFNDGQPFDPNRCAAACDATSAYNRQYLNSRAICRFFDTYVLLKNGVSEGQYCAMYTRSWDSSYATNTGYTDTNEDVYTIEYSYIYSNTTDPGANVCDAICMSQSPCPSGSSSSSTTTTASSTTKASSTTAVLTTTSSTTAVVTTTSSSKAATTTSSATASTTKSLTTTSSTTSSRSTTKSSPTTTSSSTTTSARATTTSSTSSVKPTTTSTKVVVTTTTFIGSCSKVSSTTATTLATTTRRPDWSPWGHQ